MQTQSLALIVTTQPYLDAVLSLMLLMRCRQATEWQQQADHPAMTATM